MSELSRAHPLLGERARPHPFITAPVAGVVVKLRLSHAGGVIEAGKNADGDRPARRQQLPDRGPRAAPRPSTTCAAGRAPRCRPHGVSGHHPDRDGRVVYPSADALPEERRHRASGTVILLHRPDRASTRSPSRACRPLRADPGHAAREVVHRGTTSGRSSNLFLMGSRFSRQHWREHFVNRPPCLIRVTMARDETMTHLE